MVGRGFLSELVYPITAISPTDGLAAATNLTGAACDTEATACDGVLVIVHFGAIVSGAATSIKVQQSSDDAATDDYSDIAGSAQTIVDTADGKLFLVDIKRPGKRYLKVLVDRATQNSTVSAVYLLYGLRQLPAVHATAQVGGLEKFFGPAEGTA